MTGEIHKGMIVESMGALPQGSSRNVSLAKPIDMEEIITQLRIIQTESIWRTDELHNYLSTFVRQTSKLRIGHAL